MGLRQSDVAKRLGAYTSTVTTWENGHFTPEVRRELLRANKAKGLERLDLLKQTLEYLPLSHHDL